VAAAATHSYTVLVDQTLARRNSERDVIQGLTPHLIDGVILSPYALEPEDMDLGKGTIPIVLLGDRIYDAPYDHITYDNIATAFMATQHLINLLRTHRNCACVAIHKRW
jgi:DNA-binding LacI/PurR family transcriptional regulator